MMDQVLPDQSALVEDSNCIADKSAAKAFFLPFFLRMAFIVLVLTL